MAAEFGEASIVAVLRQVVVLTRQLRTGYMIIGALAVSLWGRPRATLDVDAMILWRRKSWDLLERKAESLGFVPDEEWRRHNPMLRSFQVRFQLHGVTVDILLPQDRHDGAAFGRKRVKAYEGLRLRFISPEDLVLQKLKLGRPRDLDDAAGILERQGHRLDLRYLQRWAARLRVGAELTYLTRHVQGN